MMITIKSQREIERMREAGKIAAAARSVGRRMLRDGVTTEEINKEIHKFILSCGATPTFLGYGGFPKSACISVNDEVIHGIPGKRLIRNGDIVSIDVGATYKGYVGDCAGTFPVGEVSPEAQELIRITRQSFFEGLRHARAGGRLYDISAAVQQYAESRGCGVVRDYVGHGVGRNMHEAPEVPNYSIKGKRANPRLVAELCSPAGRSQSQSPASARHDVGDRADDQRRRSGGARAVQQMDGRHRGRQPVRPL